ncbi:MAG TPA: RnfABCDGE type electron transport complex subunit D [Candidatus Brocadiia bacterium]|nr:RnfABCDGE type electron transport complex subunit D [Candidatus Brocadiales bacterium]
MIQLLRAMLDKTYETMKVSKPLQVLKQPIDAVDTFLFGTSQVTIAAPHIRDYIDNKRYMITVVLTIVPSAIAAIYFYGWRALAIIATSYIAGILAETVFSVIRKEVLSEGAFVSCIIYPLILPPTIPIWMAAVGIVFGLVFGKEVFGGTGKNIFNPAMVGRIFLTVTFPSTMTTTWQEPVKGFFGGFTAYSVDAVTSASPLINFRGSGEIPSYWNLFFGNISGSLGETCKLVIIIGGVILMLTKVANWRLPISYIVSAALFSFIMSLLMPKSFAPPLFQILSGGLLFGAMFMATDPVSAPFTNGGKWAYGIMLGIITVLIRGLTGFVEGVMFAIIFMNIFAPLIDRIALSIHYKGIKP